MSKIRYAKFPLDCKAYQAANEAVYQKHPDVKRPEKLTMEPKHGPHRVTWMNAYIASLKQQKKDPSKYISDEKQTLGPGQPVNDCVKTPPPPAPPGVRVATIIVRVWDKSTKKPLPAASVKLTQDVPMGPEQLTDAKGTAVFSPVEPRSYTIWAWKRDIGKAYPTDIAIVTVGEGETKTVDIYLTPEHPLTLFVTVRDWTGKLVEGAKVIIGSPPKPGADGSPNLSRGPIFTPGMPYMTQMTDRQGETVFRNFPHAQYMLLAKHDHRTPVYGGGGQRTGWFPVESPRQIVRAVDKSRTWERTELRLKSPPPQKEFSIWIAFAAWTVTSVGPVFVMTIRLKLTIQDNETGNQAHYVGAFVIVGGVLSRGPGMPAEGVKTLTPGPAKTFTTPRFIDDQLVDQTSFDGPARLDLAKVEAGFSLMDFFNLTIDDPRVVVTGLKTGETTFTLPSIELKGGMSLKSTLTRL